MTSMMRFPSLAPVPDAVPDPSSRCMPVTLITGFLGAGKSSLINRMMHDAPNRRFGIIVNEFGEVPLESQIIQAQRGDIIEFSNGCMCCVARNDLMRAVRTLSRREDRFDHLIVEASGLSDPVPVAQSFLAEPDRFSVETVICVIDAENFLENREQFPVAQTQLAFADVALITKWSEKTAAAAAALDAAIKAVQPSIPIVRLAADTPLTLYLDDHRVQPDIPPGSARPIARAGHRAAVAHHVMPHCTVGSDRPVDAGRFRRFLEGLPAGLVRGKGVVFFGGKDGRRYKAILQIVGARRDLDAARWRKGETRRTDLLFIGDGIDAEDVHRRFENCVVAQTPSRSGAV
ncbi:MAG: GTP-binding protein [Spirochaetaceae bacterium]|nr:MAG: GTP-binding protein [Spirochaetaceae bacterium]